MILVDTSVIADIFTKDPDWFDWSSKQIEHWADQGPVCYDTIIFGELAVKFDTQKELEHRLSAFTYLPLPLNAAFQAGKAFEKYRRTGGRKARPLPDFFIRAFKKNSVAMRSEDFWLLARLERRSMAAAP